MNKQFAMTTPFKIQPPPTTPRVVVVSSTPPVVVMAKKWKFPTLSCDWKRAKESVHADGGNTQPGMTK